MAGKHEATATQAEKLLSEDSTDPFGHYFLSCKGREFRRYRSASGCALWQSSLGKVDLALLRSCPRHWEVLQYRKLGCFVVIQVVERFTSRRHKTCYVFCNFLPPQFSRFARLLGVNIAIEFLRNSYSVRSLLN